MENNAQIIRLNDFIKHLEGCGIFKFKVNIFNNRLKLQKYVFLARRYGFDLGYSYNLYIHGPYSPDLAKDYYALSESPIEHNGTPLPDARFIKLIKRKSEWWLELAATVAMVFDRYWDVKDEMVVKLVKDSKPFAMEDEIDKVIGALRNAGAV